MNKLECNLENKQMCKMSDDPNLDYCRACTHLLTNVKIESLAPDYPIIIENNNFIEEEPLPKHTLNIKSEIDLEDLPVENIIEAEQALRYNDGKPQWSLMDFDSFIPMIKVLEYGAHKYSIFKDKDGKLIKGSEISVEDSVNLELISTGRENWKKGFNFLKLLESLARHLFALLRGEELDKESGLPHIGHLMCNSMFYSYHKQREKNGGIN